MVEQILTQPDAASPQSSFGLVQPPAYSCNPTLPLSLYSVTEYTGPLYELVRDPAAPATGRCAPSQPDPTVRNFELGTSLDPSQYLVAVPAVPASH
jgi:hypothetical protein